jgi:drug/metabolite transporter (DMT)-like permease
MTTELKYYLNMYSDVQGYKYNFFKSKDNKLNIIPLFMFSFFAWFVLALGFEKILGNDLYKINSKSIILIFLIYGIWSFAYFSMFEKSTKHLPVMLYDIFITGILCLILTQLVFNKFYKILEKNIPILILLYFVTMILFFYSCYKYNPDLSNIKGIYEPFYLLIMVVLFAVATYIFVKLK